EMQQESRADARQVLELVSEEQARISDAKHGLSFDRRQRTSISYPAPVERHSSHEDLHSIRTIKSDMSRKTLATPTGASGNTSQHAARLSSQSWTMAPERITPQPPANQGPLSRSFSDSSTPPAAEHGPRDDVTLFVGRHGSFQLTTFHFGLIAAFVLPFHTTVLNRVTPDIDHWCARPDNMRNLSVEQWKRQMIPKMEDGNYSRCTMFSGFNKSTGSVIPCDSWEFDINARGSYVVQDFSLICDRSWGLPMSTSIFMVGAMCSLSISGPLADSNLSVEQWKRQMIPKMEDGNYSRCTMFSGFNKSTGSVIPCDSWEFDIDARGSYVVQDFSLICDRSWGLPMSTSIFMVGAMCSLSISGPLADRIGRKPLIQFSVVVAQLCGIVILFSQLFHTFLAMRFLLGAATFTLASTSYVLVIEVMAPDFRLLYGMAVLMGHAVGSVTTACLGWFNVQWRNIQIVGMLPALLLLRVITSLSESPRWLLAKGSTEEAEAVIMRAANMNGENLLELKQHWTRTRREIERTAAVKIQCFGFYPSALMTLAAVLEIPAELGAIVSAARIGRRTSHATALLCAGLAGAIALILSEDQVIPRLAVVIAVKVSVRASECLIIVYTAEVYPTLFRCTGVAFCFCFSAMGNIATQLVANTGFLDQARVPLVLVSVMCVTGAFLALQLPDSQKGRLPDTLQDVLSYWGRMNRRSYPRQRGILRTAWPGWRHKRRQPSVGGSQSWPELNPELQQYQDMSK
ncbi:sugar transporter, putative, partial [Ixodes scapularis]